MEFRRRLSARDFQTLCVVRCTESGVLARTGTKEHSALKCLTAVLRTELYRALYDDCKLDENQRRYQLRNNNCKRLETAASVSNLDISRSKIQWIESNQVHVKVVS